MVKFQGSQGCEFYINLDGCIVIKQDSYEFGKEVRVVLTPAMAWELQALINSHHEEMTFAWADGMVQFAWADGMVQEPPNA